ncbi:MAG: nuclear transport factor 2 family protein [Gammaproteobacteria bacterium]|nr:nuclear transport factor 2 family protein [Gammaproteobacteria bacterium]
MSYEDERLQRYVQYFEALTLDSLSQLDEVMTGDVFFSDPFNEVTGLEPTRNIFIHMFAELDEPRFRVSSAAVAHGNEQTGLLSWTLEAMSRGAPLRIEGMSEIKFAPDGRVCSHVDHWDAARQIYEGVPLLGAILKFLRRRLEA